VLSTFKGLIASISLVALPFAAQATSVSYDFTVTATAGSLAGDTATGSLSFDDSLLAVPNTNIAQSNLLTSLSFDWNGTSFNALTANTGQISSGAAGQLALVAFGDNCSANGCTANAADPNDWFITYNFANGIGRFGYADSAGSYVSSDVTFSPAPTPLPSAIWLFVSAGAFAAGVLRQRNGAAPIPL
jgi:hypothetical protein